MTELEIPVRLNRSGMVGSSLLRRLREHVELARLPRLWRRDLERVPGGSFSRPAAGDTMARHGRSPL